MLPPEPGQALHASARSTQIDDLAREVEQMLMRIAEGWRSATAARVRVARIQEVSADAGQFLPGRF